MGLVSEIHYLFAGALPRIHSQISLGNQPYFWLLPDHKRTTQSIKLNVSCSKVKRPRRRCKLRQHVMEDSVQHQYDKA